MAIPTIEQVADELNVRASRHPVGELQEIRKEIKGLERAQGRTIFRPQTVKDHYAFHWGGRTELQFNIALEESSGTTELRHGVAFSLETSRNMPTIDSLVPKVEAFNDFMAQRPDAYSDMSMWHWEHGQRSEDYKPAPIPAGLVHDGVFIFLGKRQSALAIDYDALLGVLDRLLELYRYVEMTAEGKTATPPSEGRFVFRAGCSEKPAKTTGVRDQAELSMLLRHNGLQSVLHDRLVKALGADNVGTEVDTGHGTNVDVVVRQHGDRYTFYEIKTAASARLCLREAIGQLLEYSLWPRSQAAERLVVVGEAALDHDAREYVQVLRERFALPLEYMQLVLD